MHTHLLNLQSTPVHPSTIRDMLRAPPAATAGSTLPAHREWEELAILNTYANSELLCSLQKRCAIARGALDTALTTLEIATHIMLGKRTPDSVEDFIAYLDAFRKAQVAGHAIFPPQQAYHNSITTLGMLVTDLVDLLPKNYMNGRTSKELKEGIAMAHHGEEAIREALRSLAGRSGSHNDALMAYILTARIRLKTWSKQEEKLKKWAEECMAAME
jgi:hypothetical protein